MANAALIAKAAATVLTDENTRKTAGWITVAILSPIILLIAFLCALASGSATHNISATELCFYGGELPADTPEEYRTYIEDMRTSFDMLDGFISAANEKTEEEKSLDRQMQYQDGLIKLVPLKTHNAKRTLYMCDKLKMYFQVLARRRSEDEIQFAALRSQNQRLIEDLGGKQIFSTALVNCLPNGKIQTVNSMKYPTREIKARFHIDFKYHHLRHTYGTLMAEMNTPTHLLCNQMGHGNIQVTQRYYIAVSKSGVNILQSNLNML